MLRVEDSELLDEAPRRSVQMHEDVVHCAPDGLLPGGALYGEPGLQRFPWREVDLHCLAGRIRRRTDALEEVSLGLRSKCTEITRLRCPPRDSLCI